MKMNHQEHLAGSPHRLRVLQPRGMGHLTGCRGSAFWHCTKFTMGCLVEEMKAGKGRDQGGLGRKKCGNQGQKGLMMCKLFLVSTHVWPCPLPHQPSLSCLPNIRYFWVTGSLFCVHVCVRRSKWQPLRGDHGSRAWVRGPVYPWFWQAQQVRVCMPVCNG